jgi:hypothetical protein
VSIIVADSISSVSITVPSHILLDGHVGSSMLLGSHDGLVALNGKIFICRWLLERRLNSRESLLGMKNHASSFLLCISCAS